MYKVCNQTCVLAEIHRIRSVLREMGYFLLVFWAKHLTAAIWVRSSGGGAPAFWRAETGDE